MNLFKNRKKMIIIFFLLFLFCFQPPIFTDENIKTETTIYKIDDANYKCVIHVNIKHPLHLYAPETTEGIPVKIDFPKISNITFSDLIYPEPLKKKLANSPNDLLLYENKIDIIFNSKINNNINEFFVEFSWQSCNDTQCFMPESKKIIFNIKNVLPLPKTEAAKTIEKTPIKKEETSQENIATTNKKKSKFQTWYDNYGIFYVMIMAFIFGIISSLTPCVYPMIPITIAFFGSKDEINKFQRFLKAFLLAIGIGLSFATLGGIFTYLGRDLGSIFASSWASFAISLILIIFAMASFEYFEIRMPSFLMKKVESSGGGKGYMSALVMGLTLGLIAAPCVGPIAGSLLIFVTTLGSVFLGFMVLFVYGLGLGMLFMVVALGATFLPKAGMWMVHLKKGFGVVILLTTIYIFQFSLPTWMLLIYSAMIFIFSAIAMDVFVKYDDYSAFSSVMSKTISVSFLITGIVLLHSGVSTFLPQHRGNNNKQLITQEENIKWVKDHDEALKLGKKLGKPVFMDFYADWCIPCKKMSKILHKPEVQKELSRFVIAKLDCTKPGFTAAKIKQNKYKAPFMPFMIFYDSKGNFLSDKSFEEKVNKKVFLKRLKTIN